MQVAKNVRKLSGKISDGNRIFIQVYPPSAFLNTYEYVFHACQKLQRPVHFRKGMMD
jgi:hypothetical protein